MGRGTISGAENPNLSLCNDTFRVVSPIGTDAFFMLLFFSSVVGTKVTKRYPTLPNVNKWYHMRHATTRYHTSPDGTKWYQTVPNRYFTYLYVYRYIIHVYLCVYVVIYGYLCTNIHVPLCTQNSSRPRVTARCTTALETFITVSTNIRASLSGQFGDTAEKSSAQS